ncbi:MAG: M67 family peptidase [Dehalococcoidia bacterium]|nr:M67 family peptidase [Dehalococcoidia bacterium]
MLRLPKQYVDGMVKHAQEDDPDECCGIIAGRNGRPTKLYRMTNVEHSPYRYSMDPKELFKTYREIEDSGWEVMAIYHSHTHTEAYPSATDVRLASWPEAFYILVSLMNKESPAVRSYRIVDGKIIPESLEVAPGETSP